MISMIHFKDEKIEIRGQKVLTTVTQVVAKAAKAQVQLKHQHRAPPAHPLKGRSRHRDIVKPQAKARNTTQSLQNLMTLTTGLFPKLPRCLYIFYFMDKPAVAQF